MFHQNPNAGPIVPNDIQRYEIELPILNVKKIVKKKKKNDVRYTKKKKNDVFKTIKFYEHENVHFRKLKISGPNDNTGQLGYVRPRKP